MGEDYFVVVDVVCGVAGDLVVHVVELVDYLVDAVEDFGGELLGAVVGVDWGGG